MRIRRWTAALGVLGALTSACGGDGGQATQAGQSAPSTTATPIPTAVVTSIPPTVVASPYSSEPTTWTTKDGWAYKFQPSWGTGTALTFSKNIQTSPPGKAKFVVQGGVPASFGGQLLGATSGRIPPAFSVPVDTFYPVTNPERFDDKNFSTPMTLDDGMQGPGLSCQFSGHLAFSEDALSKSGLPSLRGLKCGTFRSASSDGSAAAGNPTSANGTTKDDAEARVDLLLSTLNGVKPVYYVGFGAGSCWAFYFPDGRRFVVPNCNLS